VLVAGSGKQGHSIVAEEVDPLRILQEQPNRCRLRRNGVAEEVDPLRILQEELSDQLRCLFHARC